ncbi:MAG: DNA-binding protein YbiB [Burkholderiaceae bacterium]|nr:DNA-binding protein YbiB [Roseateles sp.]MBV8470569.1 DNA-binding protein YbiB [Burkholderiaceae bacterium]
MSSPSFASMIKDIGRGARGARSLPREVAESLFGAMLDGQVPPLELGAILLSLRIKGESLEETLGFCAAMQARTQVLRWGDDDATPRLVVLPSFNGARKQANLVPLVALMLARERVPVLVHGRHDFEARENPIDVLDALGLSQAGSLFLAGQDLRERHVAVLALSQLNPGLDALMALRPRLGVRNSAHSIAKLLDPAPGRSVRVVAVTHPEYLSSMASALAPLTQDHGRALLMRASEGEPYAHLRRRSFLAAFDRGVRLDLHPVDGEDLDWPLSDACAPEANAEYIKAILAGQSPVPPRIQEQVQALVRLARD